MDWIDGEPPPARHWVAPAVAELKKRPGRWACVQRYYNENSAQYAKGRLRKLGCEVRSVWNPKDAQYELFARWPK